MKEKGKDPAFLFYSQDWVVGTAEFTLEEKGAFVELLCYQHQNGFLPNDLSTLARMCRITDGKMKKIWEKISKKFEKSDDKLFNKKLKNVMQERNDLSRKNKLIGTFGHVIKSLKNNGVIDGKTELILRGRFTESIDSLLSVTHSEWNTERLTEWCENAIALIEDEDELEDKETNRK